MILGRKFCAYILMLLLLCFVSAFAETAGTELVGEWVYENDPGVTVLTLMEDGSALYGGQSLTWQDEGNDLLLTKDVSSSYRLVYEASESGITVWLPTLFTRISEIGADGEIIGTWEAEGKSQSSFVFTEDGRFLEDGVFTGTFIQDAEHGCITLQYLNGMFADTVLLYSFDGSTMVISYPWKLVRK